MGASRYAAFAGFVGLSVSESLALVSLSFTTMNRQTCVLFQDGASLAASRISMRISSGTGLLLYFLTLRLSRMAVSSSMVSPWTALFVDHAGVYHIRVRILKRRVSFSLQSFHDMG